MFFESQSGTTRTYSILQTAYENSLHGTYQHTQDQQHVDETSILVGVCTDTWVLTSSLKKKSACAKSLEDCERDWILKTIFATPIHDATIPSY
jgi:hypothetical protein